MNTALGDLIGLVAADSPAYGSPIHGSAHWRRVAALGLTLADADRGVDRELVVLFGILHDSRRVDDGIDIDHGPRAAAYLPTLGLDLPPARRETLTTALAEHSRGKVSADPTIGACWDADRLDLIRLGRPPRLDLLSTPAARDPAMHAHAVELVTGPPSWSDVLDRLETARDG
jgi:uncharacterized protein